VSRGKTTCGPRLVVAEESAKTGQPDGESKTDRLR
jgi:hypothetical protein